MELLSPLLIIFFFTIGIIFIAQPLYGSNISVPPKVFDIDTFKRKKKILYRQIKELERWGKEMLHCPEVSNNEGYKKFQNNTKYLKGMLFVMQGDLTNAFKSFLRLSYGKEKLKLFISILLPLRIIKMFRT